MDFSDVLKTKTIVSVLAVSSKAHDMLLLIVHGSIRSRQHYNGPNTMAPVTISMRVTVGDLHHYNIQAVQYHLPFIQHRNMFGRRWS